jgi:hypothetical protein
MRFSARAESIPRSLVVAITAVRPGRTPYSEASRTAPEHSITPGRSLPSNSNGCSIDPVAAT